MSRRLGNDLQTLLARVRLGSRSHVKRLLDTWPDLYSVEGADAVLSLLAYGSQSSENQLDNLDTIQVSLQCVWRAMSVGECKYTHLKKRLTDVLVANIDVLISSMAFCIRSLDVISLDDDSDPKEITRLCITECSAHFMIIMCYDPLLLHAMQASSVVADFVVLAWSWIDPRTQLPLFMGEEDAEAAKLKGCVVQMVFQIYTRGSKRAKMNVLAQLSEEGFSYAAARRFICLSIGRLRAISSVCREKTDWSPMIFGRNLKGLIEVLDQFLRLRDPVLLSAFRAQPFLQEIMETLATITTRLNFHESDTAYSLPLSIIQWRIEDFTKFDGISPLAAMCQLVNGGLLFVFLEITLHSVHMENEEVYVQSLEAMAGWITPYTVYPSVNFAMSQAWAKLDKRSLRAASKMKGEFKIATPWNIFEIWFVLGQLRLTQISRPLLCDNSYHLAVCGTSRSSTEKIRTCANCHSAVYCSEACQAMDWKMCHRELQHAHTWAHANTRLVLFSMLQYPSQVHFEQIESARLKSHPQCEIANLIVKYDFVGVPAYPDDSPSLATLPEYLKELKGRVPNIEDKIGRKRLDSMVKEFASQPDIRIVEGKFAIGGRSMWVVVRMRVPKDASGVDKPDRAAVIGGFSYFGLKTPCDSDALEAEQHTGFCQSRPCKCFGA